ncbi:recombination protein Rad52 [Dioszegia hungarica]|uniref:Recombination protein Rad52 n=1 Tax=Dioszegia hungarica TaxID=4972 RepID=A0AA38LY64_9TREE|nr:recombination protein Rad52 [Dioszegia hungarica]KAI9638506.1 recombination protein Rad52 [Dioszegia hungarica]
MQPQQSITPWSEERLAQMQVRLSRKLGPEYVSQRPGPGGGPKLSYIEGWKVINLANEVFGFSGWSSSIVSLVTDFIDVNEQGRCSISVSAQVRITLRDGAFHEDIGSGQAENVRGKASALDKAKKEAVTDATKRALRSFGNVLGNCLYDKSFTANVSKMKVPPVS